MTRPENTSKRDPLLHLAAAWPRPGQSAQEASGDYITGMEAAGQRQLVASDRLPTDFNYSKRPDFEALGFEFGDPDPDDPMFMPAKLPAGWYREGSDHAMWSYIHDERGLERVAIFYKAAFYDRSAHMSLTNVGLNLAHKYVYWESGDGPEPTIPWDVLTDDEITDVRKGALAYLKRCEEHPDIYGDRQPRAEALLAQASTR